MTEIDKFSFSSVTKKRNYELERKSAYKTGKPVDLDQHPLKGNLIEIGKDTKQRSASIKTSFVDPLNQPAFDDPLNQASFVDPLNQPMKLAADDQGGLDSSPLSLSKMVANISLKEKQEKLKLDEIKSSFEPWSLKKSSILNKYTTAEKLSITSSFLTPMAGQTVADKINANALTATRNMSTSDKIKNRIEQLDQFDDDNVQEMKNLTQQEFVKKIDELKSSLNNAWKEDDRVKSLKIVIQCSKLLADTNVIRYYPSKFVLITDILDSFGALVYERIKSKSLYTAPGSAKPQPLPEKFTADIVPASAKETCRNWFYKIASIRELLPRVYVEASILKCTGFLSDDSISKPINRLISMTAGIGDPLVAAFANCYICRVGVSIDPSIRDYQMLSFNNLLVMFRSITLERLKKLIQNQVIDYKSYLELYCPAIDWILQCLSYDRSTDFYKQILEKCIETSNENKILNGLLINSMMSSFEPGFLTSIADKLIELINRCEDEYFPKSLLFRNLGLCLIMNDNNENRSDGKKSKYELAILNNVWKTVTKFEDASNYISCAEIWIEFTLKNYTKKEINTLIGDIIKHVQQDRIFENFYPQLQSIVSKILVYVNDFSVLFSMDKFMQFLNLFQKESVKIEVCRSITNSFLKSEKNYNDDIVVINSMMQVCKSMHDYVNALTLDDEKREISQIICSFLNKIEHIERDKIEQYLNFYSDARAAFSNLDNVIALLVHKVNFLAMETLKIVKGNHTRKTASFVRACVAFTFISIPSLTNLTLKLQLYLESAHTALVNQCMSQCDALLKSAISLVADIQKQLEYAQNLDLSLNLSNNVSRLGSLSGSLTTMSAVEKYLNEYLCNFMSTLLIVPDNPEQGVIYLLTGLVNLIQKHINWENIEIKFNLLANAFVILAALKQENYLYHIHEVESNDTLYGSDVKYLCELNNMLDSVSESINEIIFNSNLTASKQSNMALDLLNRLISHADLGNKQLVDYMAQLWTCSLKSNQSKTKLHDAIANTLKLRAKSNEDCRFILTKLNL